MNEINKVYYDENQRLKERSLRYEKIISDALETEDNVISFEQKLQFIEIQNNI